MALKRIVMVDPDGRLAPILRQTLRADYLSVAHVARNFATAQQLLTGIGLHSVLIAPADSGQPFRDFLALLRAPLGQEMAGTAVLALLAKPTDREVRALIDAGVDQLASLPINAGQIDQKLRALDKLQADRRKALAAAAAAKASATGKGAKPSAAGKENPAPLPARDDPDQYWEL